MFHTYGVLVPAAFAVIASQMTDTPALVAGAASVLASSAVIYGQWSLRHEVRAVHTEVKTANSLSMAQLADNAEGRRAQKIPPAERTVDEQDHVAIMEANEAAVDAEKGGPPSTIPDDLL